MRQRGPVDRLARLGVRRPGPVGAVLLVPAWVLLGAAVLLYVVLMLLLAFLAVLTATVRLLLAPATARRGRARPADRRASRVA